MKILLANPNTTQRITDQMAAAARAVASPGTEIKPVTAEFGAVVIGSRAEMVIGEYAVMQLVAKEAEGCDAVVIAAALDSALRGIRQLLPVPVIGLTQAALHAASLCTGRIGIVASGARSAVIMREMAEGYGFGGRIAGIRTSEIDPRDMAGDPDAGKRAIIRAAKELVELDLADAVMLTGAVTAGVPAQIREQVDVPVMEGVSCAVLFAEAMVRLNLRKAVAGSFAAPLGRKVAGVGPDLEARFR